VTGRLLRPGARAARGRPSRIRRLLRLLKRLALAALAAVLLSALASALFIGVNCYSGATGGTHALPDDVARASSGIAGYRREEASTYLTLPEWYIVYNSEEYARFIAARPPSAFPYVGSIRQYWRYYGAVCGATKGVYPFSTANHVMLAVIGSSFSIEYAIKALYENTIGRAAEWLGGRETPEDAYAHATAVEYGAFMHTVPWYEFPFRQKLAGLWRTTPAFGPGLIRKWERRLALSAEYGSKALYGWLIGMGSQAAYGDENLRIHAWIENAPSDLFDDDTLRKVKDVGANSFIVTMPRYEAFTVQALVLIRRDVQFLDIAGNDEILITAIVPAAFAADRAVGAILVEPLLTDEASRRIALRVPVRSLHSVVLGLEEGGATIEHLYDY
jgi:hypothetical protein